MDPKDDKRYRKHPSTHTSWSYPGVPGVPGRGVPGTFTITSDAPVHRKLGRNDPCWCGSGLKYKRCHLGEDLPE